jgi:uncharacterized protein YfeS
MPKTNEPNQFVDNFLAGCTAFVLLGDMLRGKERDAREVVQRLIENIAKEKDIDTIDFGEIMIPLYSAVCNYGIDSIEVDKKRKV